MDHLDPAFDRSSRPTLGPLVEIVVTGEHVLLGLARPPSQALVVQSELVPHALLYSPFQLDTRRPSAPECIRRRGRGQEVAILRVDSALAVSVHEGRHRRA